MNVVLDSGLNLLKQRQVDLEAFAHYLALPQTEKWQKLNQVLTRQGIDLLEYARYLQEQDLAQKSEEEPQSVPILGGYHLLKEIGRGGMGVVYKAHHPGLNRTVAIKVLLAGEHASEKKIKRFLREIQTMAKLDHPGIVQILGSGEENAKHYLVMEYVDGTTLEAQVKKLSRRTSVALIQKMLEALQYAHTQGVIHRDIKLGNIFCSSDQTCKIGDFGLAKDLFEENEHKLTQTGTILGTSYYLAPEQIEGKPDAIDARSDLYAVGICLYRLLTKTFPFHSKNQSELFCKILKEVPISPSKHDKNIHTDLDKIVLKALEKSPEDRYPTAKEFADDLRRFLNGYPIQARSNTYQERWRRWRFLNRQKLIGMIMSLFGGVGLFLFFEISQHLEIQQTVQLLQQNARQLQANAACEIRKDFASQSQQLHHLLSALNFLNEASLLDPGNQELLSEKRKLGTTLITLACEIQNIILAEYLLQKLENWTSKQDPLILSLHHQIKSSREYQLHQHQARLRFWKEYFFTNPISETLSQDAVFEIAQMNEVEIFQELLQDLAEGTRHFLSGNPQALQRHTYYVMVASALGRLGNTKAIDPIWSSLEKMSLFIQTFSLAEQQKKVDEILFMIALTNALGNLEAFDKFLKIHELILNLPLLGFFIKETQRTYHKLAKLANISNQKGTVPENAQDYFQRALIKMQSNDFIGAIVDYTEAIRLNPKLSNAYLQRGMSKRNIRDFEGALADYTFIIEKFDNKNASAYNNRGMVRKDLKQQELALADFSIAIQIDPRNSLFLRNRGILWKEKKEYQKALEDFSESIRLQPLDIESYVERGNIYYHLKQWKQALENYNQALEIHPNYPHAYVNRGVVKKNQGDLDGALLDYDRAISLNNQNAGAYSNRARAKELKGDVRGAIIDFTEVLRILPNDTITFYNRGKLKDKIKDREGAKADFQIFLKQLGSKQADPEFLRAKQDILSLFPEFSR